ncbi:MAG: hypothetical protein K0R75_1358 [Paenibacillaceae bacterium]|jgi:hypothetical protein|nr:hypothetical protein [Paenibacillaceae bacterium]
MNLLIFGWFGLQILIVVVLILLGWLYFDRRYKKRKPGEEHSRQPGFEPTSEVFIDPKDGHKYRVYFNSRTGERDYVRED